MAQQSDPSSQTPPQPSPPSQPTRIDLEAEQPPPSEGKDATIHDFLSLCGSGSSSATVTIPKTGTQGSVATQDLLQPLQKSLNPVSSAALHPQCGFVLNSNKHQSNIANHPSAGQPLAYSLLNGILEAPPSSHSKYMLSSLSYSAKGHAPHAISINKESSWQQQAAQEGLDVNQRQPRIPSEEDEDDDDESTEHGYSRKKEQRYQKCETTEQMEGRTVDSKGLTPRSKHSATEQRRRCKINDRFQRLRQLLPNSDQKRDKASFLLEVIEYIQMLHEKVKKYEAPEIAGQERPKPISWDKNSVHCDQVVNTPYHVFASSVAYDTKEVSDSNGYSKGLSSPLRAACENGISGPELMSNVSHISALQGMAGCISSYDNKSLVNKHALLTFAQAPSLVPPERSSNPMYEAVPQTLPDGRTMFGHHIRQEEQASAMKGKGSVYSKVDAVGIPQFHHISNIVTPQASNYVLDQDREASKITNNVKENEQHEEQIRSVHPINLCPSKESGKVESRLKSDNDEKDHQISNGNRAVTSDANEQHTAAFLGGVINIRSAYSQGILDTLTQALQNAGIDLGQATISVKIDLSKPNGTIVENSNKSKTINSTNGLPSQSKEAESSHDLEIDHPKKRPKIELDS